jgi:hypothetical protein
MRWAVGQGTAAGRAAYGRLYSLSAGVGAETAVSTLVQHTLAHAARPTSIQLERMMPARPRPSLTSQLLTWLYGPLRQPVALAGLLLILLFSGLSLHQSTTARSGPARRRPTIVATATATTNQPPPRPPFKRNGRARSSTRSKSNPSPRQPLWSCYQVTNDVVCNT